MTTLTWKDYVLLAHEKVDVIFHHIGDGSDTSDAVYVLLKAMLEYCVYGYYPSINKELSIIINKSGKKGNDCRIRVNGEGLPLTCDTLRHVVADKEKIHQYLFMSPESTEKRITPTVVNTLSRSFYVRSIQNHKEANLYFEESEEHYGLTDNNEEDGIEFDIVPDKTVFGNYSIQLEQLLPILYYLLKDNPDLTISLRLGLNVKPLVFHSESLVKAEARISDAVSLKIVNIQSDDYQELLQRAQAISIVFPTDGSSSDIADRMKSVINALGSENQDILYAVEVENKLAMAPDSSIISQAMNMNYNVKKEIIGTDAEEEKDGFTMHHVYTNVIVSVILSTINQDNNRK